MTPINLSSLEPLTKLLFSVELQPVQGRRFQPTGFPDLGAATFELPSGTACLLVESAQSMANRLEAVTWDTAAEDLKTELRGISYVRVEKDGKYLTSSITEAHRLNSPYILESKDKTFFDRLKGELAVLAEGPIDRKLFTSALLRYDLCSLLHGVFLAKKELAGGRLRLERALSSFIEAEEVRVAASGGVKNDPVNPKGEAKEGFGNVPFSRDEYVAAKITAYFNIDLAQIRGYGLAPEVTGLLTLLALYKVRAFLDGDLRLRTACDFKVAAEGPIAASNLPSFTLPPLEALAKELPKSITACGEAMAGVTTVKFTS
jgi:CRISPR-associated protein Csb1